MKLRIFSFTSEKEKNLYKEGSLWVSAITILYGFIFLATDKALQVLKIFLNIP